jgi:hypothetical protein
MSQSLAILGGQPVRTRPFTSWPIFGESEEQRLLHPRSVKYKQRRQKTNSYQFLPSDCPLFPCSHILLASVAATGKNWGRDQ